jgi:hypothetical protein
MRGTERLVERGKDYPHLGEAGRRIEHWRDEDENAVRRGEGISKRLRVVHIGNRNLAAAFSPSRALDGIAHHGTNGQLCCEQPARDGAANLAGNPCYGIHNTNRLKS